MLGQMNDEQIKNVLQSQAIGRIGCYTGDKIYVVPITYAYHDGYIYCHSREGLKIQMMRQSPRVCFEVDAIENMANWRSVIIWGDYDEINDEGEQIVAMKILMDRVMPLLSSETVGHSPHSQRPQPIEKPLKAVPFRIRIKQQTGRFEKASLH